MPIQGPVLCIFSGEINSGLIPKIFTHVLIIDNLLMHKVRSP